MAPASATTVVHWGQSNMVGLGWWLDLTSPASALDLSKLIFWLISYQSFRDDVGQWTPLQFTGTADPTGGDPFDWPSNQGVMWLFQQYGFGPEVYCGLTLNAALGTTSQHVKLAVGGTYLKTKEGGGTDYTGQWLRRWGHRSWDLELPRDFDAVEDVVVGSGVATASAVQLLTDAGAAWTPGEFKGCWCKMGGQETHVLDNAATTLSLFAWAWGGLANFPTPAAYEIVNRRDTPASLARALMEGYMPAAFAAAGGTSNDMNVVAFCSSIGESDATELERAIAFKQNYLSCMWYMRNKCVEIGCTEREAHEIGFSLGLIKVENGIWVNGPLVVQALREIADADPNAEVCEVEDLQLGGRDGTDPIHYDAEGQRVHGQRHGNNVVAFLTPGTRARKSHRYYGQHEVFRPVWGIGDDRGVRRLVSVDGLLAADAASRLYPVFYLFREGGEGRVPIYLTSDGLGLSNVSGELIGYAGMRGASGWQRVTDFVPRSQHRGPLRRGGGLVSTRCSGWAIPAGVARKSPFEDVPTVISDGALTHTVTRSPVISTMQTSGPGLVADWMRRCFSGGRGISGTLRIVERCGADVGQLWMEHRIGHGDYTEPHAGETGFVKLPPARSETVAGGTLISSTMGMEWNCDASVPTLLETREVDHGGVAANCEAVLWPNVTVQQEVTPNWRGIEGCFRIVYSWLAPFEVGGDDNDTVSLEIDVHGTPDADVQFVYDPDTDTLTDLSWTQLANQFRDYRYGDTDVYDKDGTLNSTIGSTLLSRNRGMVGWQDSVGGITWGLYNQVHNSLGKLCTHLRAGQHREPQPADVAGYADHDQRDFAHLQQRSEWVGTYPAAVPIRVAAFLCVGTMAQVRAAAQQLSALGANSRWTD